MSEDRNLGRENYLTVSTEVRGAGEKPVDSSLEEEITALVRYFVAARQGNTAYGEPLIGFASAADPLWPQLKQLVGPDHLLPRDLLPGARSVIAVFVPFTPVLTKANRGGKVAHRSWAVAYVETNALLEELCRHLAAFLAGQGVESGWQKPTHNFDPVNLRSYWSHKHVAYICGLGTFGCNQQLITPHGCAGRLVSLVVDTVLTPTPRPTEEHCLVKRGRPCGFCWRACPVGALTEKGLDKKSCYRHLLEVANVYRDLGLCDVCGKCSVGPCAHAIPKHAIPKEGKGA